MLSIHFVYLFYCFVGYQAFLRIYVLNKIWFYSLLSNWYFGLMWHVKFCHKKVNFKYIEVNYCKNTKPVLQDMYFFYFGRQVCLGGNLILNVPFPNKMLSTFFFTVRNSVLIVRIAMSFGNGVPKDTQCRTARVWGLQLVVWGPEQDPQRNNANHGAGWARRPGHLSQTCCLSHLHCRPGRGSLDESGVKARLLPSFSHANFRRVFLPSSPWLFRMYFRENFFILQTTQWHRAGFVARGNAKQGDKLTPTGHCRKKLASGSCSCQTFSTSGRSNQLQWCSKARRRRRRRACGAQSMLQSKGRGRASWLLRFQPRAKNAK